MPPKRPLPALPRPAKNARRAAAAPPTRPRQTLPRPARNARRAVAVPRSGLDVLVQAAVTHEERERKCNFVQRWWRRAVRNGGTTAQIVADFFEKGLKLEEVKAMHFDRLAEYLREPELAAVMTRVVLRVFYLAYGRKGTRKIADANLNIRVFFAAYMIHFRQSYVFEFMGPTELTLRETTLPLIDTFHSICDGIRSAGPAGIHGVAKEVTNGFPEMLSAYVIAFKNWKIPDEKKLGARIEHALAALYVVLMHHCAHCARLRGETLEQIDRLRYKLVQVGGMRAVRAADAANGWEPRPIMTNEQFAQLRETPDRGGAQTSRMTNEQLAFELMVDPTFKLGENGLPEGGTDNIQRKVVEVYHDAFWTSLVDDLALNVFFRMVRVLTEIRDGIAELGSGQPQAAEIVRIINVDAMYETMTSGAFEWRNCVALANGMIGVIQKMQAPARDAQTAAKWAEHQERLAHAEGDESARPEAFVKAVEFVLSRVNLIRIDAANTRLRAITPVITLHGIEYMRACLERKTKGGLKLTRALEMVAATVAATGPPPQGGLSDQFVRNVVRRTVFTMVSSGTVLDNAACVEPWWVLTDRLRLWQTEFNFAVLAVVTQLTLPQQAWWPAAAAIVAGPITDFFGQYKIDMWLPEPICEDLKKSLLGKGVSEADASAAHTLAVRNTQEGVLRGVMHKRVVGVWVHVLETGETPAMNGFPPHARAAVERALGHAREMRRVLDINIAIHAVLYNKMLERVLSRA